MDYPALYLAKGHERRLRAGHLWIYSNEVDSRRSPLKAFEAGEPVAILGHDGRWLAWGYVNPNSLICARVVSRHPDHPLDRSLLVHRLKVALGLRQRRFDAPYYRLLFAESDGLPGLVVDRYGDHLVAQVTTAGMERQRPAILAALEKVLRPAGVLWRNDSPVRALEGLPSYVETAAGEVPEVVTLKENGCAFETHLQRGQKSGWFYDQAANRARLRPWVAGKRILDLFSYAGAWAVTALAAGARSALCVDQSALALSLARRNAELNRCADRLETLESDAFAALRELKAAGERFDIVLVDPPAFIKRKKDYKEGSLAYRRINEAALGVLERDGLLVSSSCSYHLSETALLELLQKGARHRDRALQLLERGQQGPDHPVHPAIPETAYLKTLYLRVLPPF